MRGAALLQAVAAAAVGILLLIPTALVDATRGAGKGEGAARNGKWLLGAGDCEEKWFDSVLDHFRHRRPNKTATFPLRYLTYSKRWGFMDGRPGPIFFYAGHEQDVELYADNIGESPKCISF